MCCLVPGEARPEKEQINAASASRADAGMVLERWALYVTVWESDCRRQGDRHSSSLPHCVAHRRPENDTGDICIIYNSLQGTVTSSWCKESRCSAPLYWI